MAVTNMCPICPMHNCMLVVVGVLMHFMSPHATSRYSKPARAVGPPMAIEAPLLPLPPSDKLHLLRTSNIFGIATEPFDPATYQVGEDKPLCRPFTLICRPLCIPIAATDYRLCTRNFVRMKYSQIVNISLNQYFLYRTPTRTRQLVRSL